MVSYLLKTLVLAVFSFIIIYFYYFSSGIHIENFDGYMSYIIIVGIIYAVYKFFQLEFSEKKASFSLFKIFSLFLAHLLILCILFFTYNDGSIGSGLLLFFKILYFSFFPLLIILISLGFGKKISSYLSFVKNETDIYKFLISLGIGFFSFVFLLDIVGILGFYNLYVVFLILAGFVAFSCRELLDIFKSIISYKFEFEIEEGSYLRLISSEFLFLVSTLVISISLISIVRPFPIGWDDLGVYMNYPHLMAEAGSIISLGGMYAWQTFTGIGYMFGSPTQAFFLNNVGGILSFIAIVLIISDLLKSTSDSKTKTFLNIPMLVGTMFISMPMIVFQQAKDMKLDPGLFFVSIIVVYLILKYYNKPHPNPLLGEERGILNKIAASFSFKGEGIQGGGIIIFIIGLLAGFAFSIKFTTLLLISATIGLMFFARLGIVGFIGYLAIFFAIFTKANLWEMMNVVVNPSKIVGFETNFALVSGGLGLALLWYSLLKNRGIIKKFFLEIGIFVLGILLVLLPWMGKNIVESYPNISIGKILSGTSERFKFDKTLIYSENEIKEIKAKRLDRMGSDGTTTNEDLGRYFGYEKGINNHIKLPWNLTMQVNQVGEYTDIGFLFLALLPALLLFLPFRKKYYSFLIVLILILELLIFVKTDNKVIEKSSLSALPETSITILFDGNSDVFKNKKQNKDIYDIKISDYIAKGDIQKLVNKDNSFEVVSKKATELFYQELKTKVLDKDSGEKIALTNTLLSDKDFEYIKELRTLNSDYLVFKSDINSIVVLGDAITKFGLEADKDALIKIWKNNRTFNQFVSDFFSSFSLPFGYLIILLIFFIPSLALLFLLDSRKTEESTKINLFKLNIVFASFYTFLWAISAFGIVWYGITMYFSFLLAIAIGAYYISSYKDDDNEKFFYTRLFGTLVFALIFMVYASNSIFPHTFKNLKGAGYAKYKIGEITTVNAPYLYHQEYLKILFHLNIDQNKKEEFIKEFIKDDIKKAVNGIEKMDIFQIRLILNEIIKKNVNNSLTKSAIWSLNNIYKNISNPSEKYKSKVGIYRIGTFLKYHISENNKRLLEDSLIFSFNDYIYNSNVNKTVDNLKKIGLGYLLVDLNAATIDKDERRNLTKRYEKLLNTFTSDKLELVETDSVCLKVALEEFSKSKKLLEDRDKFLYIAGVNYESYTEDGKVIGRGTKLMQCYRLIDSLIKEEKIDKDNYSYLLNLKNYIVQNKEAFKTEQQLFALLQQQVTHGYKVLFRIK